MKPKTFYFIFVVFFLAFALESNAGQEDEKVFQNLRSCLDTVNEPLPDGSSWGKELDNLWKQMDSEISTLQKAASEHTLSAQYRQNIESTSSALMKLAADNDAYTAHMSPVSVMWTWEPVVKHTTKVCRAMQRDLQVKVDYVLKNEANPFGKIDVKVRTFKGTQEIGGCEVWYIGFGWLDASDSMKSRFDEISSPTDGFLAPGYYTMWTTVAETDGEESVGNQETFTIDHTTQTIDLTVPQ